MVVVKLEKIVKPVEGASVKDVNKKGIKTPEAMKPCEDVNKATTPKCRQNIFTRKVPQTAVVKPTQRKSIVIRQAITPGDNILSRRNIKSAEPHGTKTIAEESPKSTRVPEVELNRKPRRIEATPSSTGVRRSMSLRTPSSSKESIDTSVRDAPKQMKRIEVPHTVSAKSTRKVTLLSRKAVTPGESALSRRVSLKSTSPDSGVSLSGGERSPLSARTSLITNQKPRRLGLNSLTSEGESSTESLRTVRRSKSMKVPSPKLVKPVKEDKITKDWKEFMQVVYAWKASVSQKLQKNKDDSEEDDVVPAVVV